jgi:hypothetical protein
MGGINMHVEEVSMGEYKKFSSATEIVFNQAEFLEINRERADDIKYLVIYKDNSPRFRVCFGIKTDGAYCPFSAPFSYITPIKSGLGIRSYEEAVCALDEYFLGNKIAKATMTFPPDFYDKNNVDTWVQVMLGKDWKIDAVDISFAFCLGKIRGCYEDILARNARKNLHIAMKSHLKLRECVDSDEKRTAYAIIKENRKSKGYPLRMSQEQVMKTIEVVPARMFIVSDEELNHDLAAALVYDVTDKIAQVVYWGDIPGHPEKKVINFLAYELIRIYGERGFEYLDIGPSTENGIPNYGLCDFKDGIGCDRSMKFRIYKQYR